MLCFSSRQSCICNIQTVQRLTFAWLWKCKSICNTLRTPHWQIHVAIQLRLQIQHPSLLNNAIHHLHGLLHIHRHPLDPSDDIIQQNHPANTSWCLTIMFHKRTLKLSHELISEMVAYLADQQLRALLVLEDLAAPAQIHAKLTLSTITLPETIYHTPNQKKPKHHELLYPHLIYKSHIPKSNCSWAVRDVPFFPQPTPKILTQEMRETSKPLSNRTMILASNCSSTNPRA